MKHSRLEEGLQQYAYIFYVSGNCNLIDNIWDCVIDNMRLC